MPEDTVEYIPVTYDELVELIRTCGAAATTFAFAPGGVALTWKTNEPMPAAVERLGLMRGVLNENMDGAGI